VSDVKGAKISISAEAPPADTKDAGAPGRRHLDRL
jgi:hypothetical protein